MKLSIEWKRNKNDFCLNLLDFSLLRENWINDSSLKIVHFCWKKSISSGNCIDEKEIGLISLWFGIRKHFSLTLWG